ncbi:MAG: GNAT family N-acetyltransferase [Spirochaetaceae bacterium]|nr:GNAT family N-acetyltransferase [Spirochaetaceae bacterium]
MAKYEKLEHEFSATETLLEKYLFGEEKAAEVILGYYEEKPVAMALFFKNFSTFLSKPGIYLEDLFVIEEMRGRGLGKAILTFLAEYTRERNFGRLEWSVLDWNKPAVDFYRSIGAVPMTGWTIQRLTGKALEDL